MKISFKAAGDLSSVLVTGKRETSPPQACFPHHNVRISEVISKYDEGPAWRHYHLSDTQNP